MVVATTAIAVCLPCSPAAASRQVSLKGTLVTDHADYLPQDASKSRARGVYFMRSSTGKRYRLRFRNKPNGHAGERVSLKGDLSGHTVAVDSSHFSAASATASASAASAPGPRKIAVLLINFQNNQSQPWTPDQVRGYVFTNSSSVNEYYKEESSGTVSLTGIDRADGDVFGWYTISSTDTNCDPFNWGVKARTMANAQGHDMSGYDNYIYVTPETPNCGYAGLAELPSPNSPADESHINGFASNLRVVSHELAHNLGVHHSSTITCYNGDPIPVSYDPGNCDADEYGDPFDVMGQGKTYQHNNEHKANFDFQMGTSFLTGTTQTIAQDGTYNLQPSEPGFTGNQVLRIPRSATQLPYTYDYYYLDYRRPFGTWFDSFSPADPAVNGVTIRVGPDYGQIIQTRLVDTTPGDLDFTNAPLATGKTYTDIGTGMTIKTLTTSPAGAQVQIANVPGKVEVRGSELTYSSFPGVRNNVTVSLSGGTYTVTERGEALLPYGAGCSATADPQVVECDATGVTQETITLGEGDDRFTNDAATKAVASGGTGQDQLNGGPADDTLNGDAGNDTLDGRGGNDLLVAGADADTLTGGPGNDSLEGGAGTDTLNGADDNDTLLAGPDADTINGGAGIDIADYSDHFEPIKADLDSQLGDDGQSREHDTIATDVEGLRGGESHDRLTGNSAANMIDGGLGDDRIFGAPSASGPDSGDTLIGDLGRDKIYGRKGDDTIAGGFDDDSLYGEDGNDTLIGDTGANKIYGGDGDDTLTSLVGGIDKLYGNAGNDVFHSKDGDGQDQLTCGKGANSGEADSGDLLKDPAACALAP